MYSFKYLYEYIIFFNFIKIENLIYLFIFCLIFSTHFVEYKIDSIKTLLFLKKRNKIIDISFLLTLILMLTIITSDNNNPFIYFRF